MFTNRGRVKKGERAGEQEIERAREEERGQKRRFQMEVLPEEADNNGQLAPNHYPYLTTSHQPTLFVLS